PIDCPVYLFALAIEKLGHRRRQPRVRQEMHTDGRLGVKAAQPLEVPAGARLEARHLVANAVVNGCVVAHVKMEMPQFAERPPIAAVEHPALLHIESAGDNFPLVPCHDETEIALEAGGEQVEEA